MKFLVDSDLTADYLDGYRRAIQLIDALLADGIAISLVTYGEIYEGIFNGRDPRDAERVFRRFLRSVKVIPLDRPIMRQFARIRGDLRSKGQLIPDPDIMIAATAMHRDLTLVTRAATSTASPTSSSTRDRTLGGMRALCDPVSWSRVSAATDHRRERVAMAKVLKSVKSIDVGESPDLVRLVEEVAAGGEPVVLRADGRDLAILEPLTEGTIHRTQRVLTPEEVEAFESSAGAWKGLIDGDELIREIYANRGRPVEPEE